MSGDPSNARLWSDADVYVAFDVDAPDPANVGAAFGAEWDLVGLLNGEDGFTESRNWDETDHYAWGGILVRTGRRNFKLTKSFTAVEYNGVVRRLMWPGSDVGEIKVPRPERVKIAFELRDGDTGQVHRLISAYEAEVMPDGDREENEADVSQHSFMVTIFPDDDGVLFIEQTTSPVSA
jgi:hypothetical protein